MINPQNYVISAIAESLPNYVVRSNVAPRGINTPNIYILITDVSINEYARCKHSNEWLVGLNIDVTYRGGIGYDYTDYVNNAVQEVIPAMKDLKSNVIEIKNVFLEGSISMYYDTPTNSVNRQILTYSIWCEYQES